MFLRILREVRIQFVDNTPEQKLRNTVLEIINKLPSYDALRPHVPELAREVMRLLENENEDNAAVCLRIIIELHKNFRSPAILEDQVQPFFELVQRMYRNLPTSVRVIIDKHPAEKVTKRTHLYLKKRRRVFLCVFVCFLNLLWGIIVIILDKTGSLLNPFELKIELDIGFLSQFMSF